MTDYNSNNKADKIIPVEILNGDEERWNNLLATSYNSSYRLSLVYNRLKTGANKQMQAFVFNKKGEDIAGAVYFLNTGLNGFIKTADIQSGILFKEERDVCHVSEILRHFIDWAKKKNASFIRVSPWLLQKHTRQVGKQIKCIKDKMVSLGFKSVKEGRHTYWIDLNKSDESLMSDIKRKKIRQQIRKGVRLQVVTDAVSEPDNCLLEEFWHLYSSLSKEKSFLPDTKEVFIRTNYELLVNRQAYLFVTRFNRKNIYMHLVSNIGNPAGIYAAMNMGYREIPNCPPPGPINTWQIITFFKKNGYNTYDMGFCPGAIPVEEHPNYKIWDYKYSFGGDHVQFTPVYGKVLHPIKGKIFEMLRYKNKKLFKRLTSFIMLKFK